MSESESNTNPSQEINNDQTPKISLYEKSRQERIKSNLERMQKLGLFDLSLKLKSPSGPKRTYRNNPSPAKHPSPFHSSGPVRRSSRLQNTTPVTYSEVVLAKNNEDEDFRREVGSKPEVYTEEHLKLLGNTERSWEFFVDGYGKDGKRIYDPINGKTCHQCRQKTLGYRTHCSRCNLVQGQFCGDCLYMRYGEHVLEATENPNWICPPCRGICNCSLCRQAKGWAPTGSLYRKISSMGYKSVAHYLIETQRSQNTVEKDSVTGNQVSAKSLQNTVKKDSVTANQISAKRSLPFPEEEKPSTISNQVEVIDTQTKRSLLFPASEECSENMESVEVKPEAYDHPELTESKFEEKTESELKCEKENHVSDNGSLATDGQTKILITADGKAATVKMEPENANDHLNSEFTLGINEKTLEVTQYVINSPFANGEMKKEEELQAGDGKSADRIAKVESCPKLKKKTAPNPDSIGARLRQKRRMETQLQNA